MSELNTQILDAATAELKEKQVALDAAARILPDLGERISRVRSYGTEESRQKAEVIAGAPSFLIDSGRALKVRFDTALGNAARAKAEATKLIALGPLNTEVLGTRIVDVLLTQNQKLVTMARGVQKLAAEIDQHVEKAADLEADVLKLEGKATSESKLTGFLTGAGAFMREAKTWALIGLGGVSLFYGGPLLKALAGFIPRRKEEKKAAA